MKIAVSRPTDVIVDPKPIPPEEFARRWLARNTGASPALAETYRTLVGLGSYREGASR